MRSNHLATRKTASNILFSAKTQTKHIQKVELKSLYFNLAYVLLFSAKTRIYNKTNTLSGAENSLFQFCLTITEPRFLLSISRTCLVIFTHR